MRKFQLIVLGALLAGGLSGCSSSAPRNETAQTNPQRPIQQPGPVRPNVSPQANQVNGPTTIPADNPSAYVSSNPGPTANSPDMATAPNPSNPAVNRAPNQPLVANRPNPRAAAEIGSGENADSPTGMPSLNLAGAGAESAESNGASAELAESKAQPTGKTGTGLGDTIPEIEGKDFDGERFALSDYEGKVLMIDFWGDW